MLSSPLTYKMLGNEQFKTGSGFQHCMQAQINGELSGNADDDKNDTDVQKTFPFILFK